MRLSPILAIAACGLAPSSCYNPGDLGQIPYKCTTNDLPDCPDGYVCTLNPVVKEESGGTPRCVVKTGEWCYKADPMCGGMTTSLNVSIPKSGMYTGMKMSLPFTMPPDFDIEPNGFFTNAHPIGTGPLGNLAIAPAGDVDLFKATLTSPQYAKVTLTYQVAYGDLDLAFVDSKGALKEYDGTSTNNACVKSSGVVTGDIWVVVVGAGNKEQAPFGIKLDLSESPQSCP